MRCFATCCSGAILGLLLLLGGAPSASAADGDWPMWRHDNRLTGWQAMPANLTSEPRVLAKYFLGATQGAPTFADLRGTGQSNDIIIVARAKLTAYDADGRKLWESAPAGYVPERVEWVDDLAGDGRKEVVAVAGHVGLTHQAYLILDSRTGALLDAIDFGTGGYGWNGHCGSYLPGLKSKQIFLVTSCEQPVGGPVASFGHFSLWTFDGRKAERKWSWEPNEQVVYYPAVMVGDLNGNAHFYGVVDSWCHVWNIDLATGEKVSHTTWDPQGANARQYGWNELADVDGDGKLDFINISMTKHVDVLRNVGGKLQLAWTHGWPDPVTTEARSLHVPSDPVTDLVGDGRREIVCGLFDGVTDHRWHLFIFDAATGVVAAEAANLVPIASVPLWGAGGGRALLCVHSSQIEFQPAESCEAWRLRNGRLEKLWSQSKVQFLLQSRDGDDRHHFAFNAMRPLWAITNDVDGDGRPEFFTSPDGGRGNSQAWGIDREGGIVAKSGRPPEEKATPLPEKIPALEGKMVPTLLAASLNGRPQNNILVYDNTNATVLRLAGHKLRRVEDIPSSEIPVVCDLQGDNQPCLLTAGRGVDGNLWVQARNAARKVLWRFVFPHSGACGQYSERPLYFTVGHFTGGKNLDVFTYATKPAARTYLLDGRTGKIIWQREQLPEIERHFQPFGGRGVVYDANRDGADDLLFCNPDYYCVADGRTGNLLFGPVFLQPLFPWWPAYGSPAVLENSGSAPFVYLGGVYSGRAALSLDGKRGLWGDYLPTDHWPMREGNNGFNEALLPPTSGRGWRGAQAETDGALVCFDAATGKHCWQMQLPTAPSGIISGDIDGSGAGDLLFGGEDGNLVAVADGGGHPQILWRKKFDAPVGTPILADVNGDGKSEIIVSVGDGFVYVLGN